MLTREDIQTHLSKLEQFLKNNDLQTVLKLSIGIGVDDIFQYLRSVLTDDDFINAGVPIISENFLPQLELLTANECDNVTNFNYPASWWLKGATGITEDAWIYQPTYRAMRLSPVQLGSIDAHYAIRPTLIIPYQYSQSLSINEFVIYRSCLWMKTGSGKYLYSGPVIRDYYDITTSDYDKSHIKHFIESDEFWRKLKQTIC